MCLPSLLENFYDLLDRVPITSRRCDAKFFLDLAKIADRLHLPTIQTENESVLDRNDLQQPVLIRRQDREEDKTAREVVWSDRSGGRLHCGIFKVAAYSLTLLKLAAVDLV